MMSLKWPERTSYLRNVMDHRITIGVAPLMELHVDICSGEATGVKHERARGRCEANGKERPAAPFSSFIRRADEFIDHYNVPFAQSKVNGLGQSCPAGFALPSAAESGRNHASEESNHYQTNQNISRIPRLCKGDDEESAGRQR